MRAVIVAIITTFILVLLCVSSFDNLRYSDSYNVLRKIAPTRETNDWSLFNECDLKVRDPWEGDIKKYVDLKFETKRKCNTKFSAITYLSQGRLFVNGKFRKSHLCFGRCVNRKTDKSNDYGNWINVTNEKGSEPFDCDIVESLCTQNGTDVYGMIHAQIVPKPEKYNNTFLYGQQFNVHVILLDSTASTQAYRNLPNTMEFLEKSMDGISFPFVNKVGLNSKPNGIPLWFGKLDEKVDKVMFGMENIEADVNEKNLCKNYHDDNMTIIMREFTDRGYMTFMAEDWSRGTVNYPNCNGLRTPPTDHYMRPFQIAYEKKGAVSLTRKENNCVLSHKPIFEYFRDFLKVYKDTLTFSWTWLSNLGHDNSSGSRLGDTDILQLLLDHRKTFDDSFFILMGDHGLRFGQVTKTPLGSLEVNNPLFILSLPKALRSNIALVSKLRYNSRFLQTPFDIRATLLDILKYQPQSNYTSNKPLHMEGERGESLMREQLIPRNCKDLPIPSSFCICPFDTKKLNVTDPIAGEISNQVIEEINQQLKANNISHMCQELRYKHTTRLETFSKKEGTYFISFETQKPADAHFRTIVQMTSTNSKPKIGAIDRVDSYGKKGDCVHQKLRQLCTCKK